jgi:hypothetical protein
LAPRETEILTLVSEGMSNKAVARRRNISVHTVKCHLDALFAKLDATSRARRSPRACAVGYWRSDLDRDCRVATRSRCQVTKRKVSGGTRSDVGRDCRDAFLGLAKTCAKLGISFWDYLGDRLAIPGNPVVPSLPSLVSLRCRSP